jgi:cyclohexyl-isocyanide hydratase
MTTDDHDPDFGEPQRRDVLAALGAMAAASAVGGPALAADTPPIQVGMVVYPDMVLLDLVGPQTALSLGMAEIHLVWKSKTPVSTDVGVPILPTRTFADAPKDLDVLFVPGGLKGSTACMSDPEVLAFLADRGARARYVTSVCTGSLMLGAAGLLKGYNATSHWYVRDLLPLMGATTKYERIVTDRNRITAGGVTAGLDFGLSIVAALRGEDFARRVQLTLEYSPAPPFKSGTPEEAGAVITEDVRGRRAPLIAAAKAAAEAAGKRI